MYLYQHKNDTFLPPSWHELHMCLSELLSDVIQCAAYILLPLSANPKATYHR